MFNPEIIKLTVSLFICLNLFACDIGGGGSLRFGSGLNCTMSSPQILNGSGSVIKNGARLNNVEINFDLDIVEFTKIEFDLEIDGNAFLILKNNGVESYARTGVLALNSAGYIVGSNNSRLQGLPADSAGNISDLPEDIRIQTHFISPRTTTTVNAVYNLDSSAEVIQSRGSSLTTTGNAIGVAQSGLQDSLTTTLNSNNFTLPLVNNFNLTHITLDVELTAASQNQGTVTLNLNAAGGVPVAVTNFNELSTLVNVINSQLSNPVAPQARINVTATAVNLGAGNYRLDFNQVESGEASQIRVLNGSESAANLGLPTGAATTVSTPGVPAVDNGYPQQSIEITDNDGEVITFTSTRGATAAATASQLNSLTGINANASTSLTLVSTGYTNSVGNLIINLNGVNLIADNFVALEREINNLTTSTLLGISADIDLVTGNLDVTSLIGDDLVVAITSTDDGDSLTAQGTTGSQERILEVDALADGVIPGNINAQGNSIIVGGSIDLTLQEGITFSNSSPAAGLFGPLNDSAYTPFIYSAFDPADQTTYSYSSSVTIYDSLGNSHIQTHYFVKQDYDPDDLTTAPNHWKLYIQVDNRDVGDPDETLSAPYNTHPTRAEYDIFFHENGSINSRLTDDILVSNWGPMDEEGFPTGALRPIVGAASLAPGSPKSSNFLVNLTGTTQFNSDFYTIDMDQNGYEQGRVARINIDDTGIIYSHITSGETEVWGQVALADFYGEKDGCAVGQFNSEQTY